MPGLLGSDVVKRSDRGPLARNMVLFGQVDRQSQIGELGRSIVG